MPEPCPEALQKARAKVEEAHAALREANTTMIAGHWPGSARELRRAYGPIGVWLQPGGWFDCLAKEQK